MLIHVEANQFFPDSNYPRCSGQPVLRFKLLKTIERRGLIYGERSSPHSRRSLNVTKLVLHIPIPLSLLLLLFFFRGLPRVISRNSAPWINTRRPNPPSNAPFPRHRSFRFPKLPPHRLRGVITRQPRAFSFPSPRNFPFSSTTSSRWESRWGRRTLHPVSGGIRISEVDLVWISRELWSNDNPVIL